MGNFQLKQFDLSDTNCSMKIGTDAILLGAYISCKETKNILDIGTGSGIIALMLAQKSNALIEAIEIDKKAALQAKENFSQSIWSNRLTIENISIQEYCKKNQTKYDLIVCNPPYFSNSLKTHDKSRNLARHNDTLDFDNLLNSVKILMTNEGLFYLILPVNETLIFERKSSGFGLFCIEQLIIKPKPSKQANRIVSIFSFTEKKRVINNIDIRNDDNTYTQNYIQLTGDYYINF